MVLEQLKENIMKQIMGRKYYIDKYKEFYDNCLIEAGAENPEDVTTGADILFEETAGAEEIAGYYFEIYKDKALETWKQNLSYAQNKGLEKETDKAVIEILQREMQEV